MLQKSVAIIVVTYNRLKLLQEEIDALRKQSYTDYQIIVVNNGSTDDSLSWLQQQKDLITITQENVGGAGGFFTGMKYAAEHDFEYCWVMDDDVICKPNALEELVNGYKHVPDAGFICSKVIGSNGCSMNVPYLDLREGKHGYSEWYNESEYGLLRVKKATFVSVLFPTKIIKEVGLPLREYFIWGDDWEYTQRISTKHVSYMSLNSVVVHMRALQQRIIFENEKDTRRIKNYFYAFRNNSYNDLKYKEKTRFHVYASLCYHAMKCFGMGKITHGMIYVKSLFSLMAFSPKIQFPDE